MFKFFRVTAFTLATAFFGLAGSSANATYNYFWDVSANVAGVASTVTLGDSVSVDACGSRLFVVNYSAWGNSLCSVANTNQFSVNWYAKNLTTNTFAWLTGPFVGAADPENVNLSSIPLNGTGNLNTNSIATGAGTFFSSAGTYLVGVHVAVKNALGLTENIYNGSSSISNFYAYTSTDSTSSLATALSSNGALNNAAAQQQFTLEAAAVPEPESILLLVPALFMMMRRQRRKQANV